MRPLRVNFFSPLPPSPSGIADYSHALAQPLGKLVDLHLIGNGDIAPRADADISVYQIGNNRWHGFAYTQALRAPGVVVLHEANLHHLVADITIRNGDWDAYVAEAEFDSGASARAHAERARSLVVGPDYDRVPMLRRVLQSARGLIAHSEFVINAARDAGFRGPAARIPHGAWLDLPPGGNTHRRMATRHSLGVDANAVLIGAFGYLKPYKRIGESLRAFRRLVRIDPRVRLILAGEAHPDFPVKGLIDSLQLEAHVRLLGFTPLEHFAELMSACDVILNLRYPTVGETSGSLLRALGLGKPVLVSDIGAFSEFPDEICIKVPIGHLEEEMIFEYLSLLTARPEVGREIGQNARLWTEQECSWDLAAERYAGFLEAVAHDRPWPADAWSGRKDAVVAVGTNAETANSEIARVSEGSSALSEAIVEGGAAQATPDADEAELLDYIRGWATDEPAREYIEAHAGRFLKTLEMIPPGNADATILEMGIYCQITPALRKHLGYGTIRGCYYGRSGVTEQRSVRSTSGEVFSCSVELFDAEKDRYPYPDASFQTVLCCELIEHLFHDPMFLMGEVNRILVEGGHFLMTTPNAASLRAVGAIMEGHHPAFFSAYLRPDAEEAAEPRHNREYTPGELKKLFEVAGFEVARLETGPFRWRTEPEYAWVQRLLERTEFPSALRGDDIFCLGRKTGPVKERWPAWLFC